MTSSGQQAVRGGATDLSSLFSPATPVMEGDLRTDGRVPGSEHHGCYIEPWRTATLGEWPRSALDFVR